MDLALALGQPVNHLARTMSVREFARWSNYASKRMLPWRRMECYLAQIAQMIAMTGGAREAKLEDYLFQPREVLEEVDEEELLAQAIEEFDFKPRNVNRKKD